MVSQRRAWLAAHKQALAYGLAAVSMAATVGATIVGGFYLHHAADLERQTLRTQRLGGAAFRLQDFLSRAQAEQGVSTELARERGEAVAAVQYAFQQIRKHDRDEANRLELSYIAYLRGSQHVFSLATTNRGRQGVGVGGGLRGVDWRLQVSARFEVEP